MHKMIRRYGLLFALLVVVVTGVWISFSRPAYEPPRQPELRKRVNYLARVIAEGAGPGTGLAAIGEQTPEWALFTLSFSTYAFTNLATQDTSFRAEAGRLTGQAIELALSEPIRGPFEYVYRPGLPDTTHSVLYLGHLELMLGCHRQLVPSSRYAALHDAVAGALYRRFQREPAGCLESYSGQRWLPDNIVALAALALHNRLTGSPYEAAGRRWTARARQQWCQPGTGLLMSQVDSVGRPMEEPRGSMLGWGIWFLARFDSTLAAEQYTAFREQASTNFGVVRLYRERPNRYTTGFGDIDSGPLILGYSIPANAFALADAVALHDLRNAARLRRLVALGSRTRETDTEISYGVRLVDLPVSPLAEALLLWAETGSSLATPFRSQLPTRAPVLPEKD